MRKFLHYFGLAPLLIAGTMYGAGNRVPFALLRKLIPANAIVFEAGAQFGEDTSWMSEMWPEGKIYSFEPNPEAYPKLEQVAAKYKNIITDQRALSDKEGIFAFYIAGGASSLLKPAQGFNDAYFHADLEHPTMVPVTTIDTWAKKNNISHVDFMWLDMEGNELNALKAATSILHTVRAIFMEVNLNIFWEKCVLHKEMKEWLESRGFEQVWEDMMPDWQGNVLFVNKNM